MEHLTDTVPVAAASTGQFPQPLVMVGVRPVYQCRFTFASNEFVESSRGCFTLESDEDRDSATTRRPEVDFGPRGRVYLAPDIALAGHPIPSPHRSSAHHSGERPSGRGSRP